MADAPLITIAVGEIDDAYADYTSIRLYRATTIGGSYSVITTLTLVDGQTAYTYEDTSGTAGGTDWYKWSFYHTGTTAESASSEPFPPGLAPMLTRQELRRRSAFELLCYLLPGTTYSWPGASGTSTGAGSTTTLVDSAYVNSLTPTLAYTGAFVLLNGGSASGQERQVASFDKVTGTFTLTPAYSASTGNGTTWDGYRYLGSSAWNECIEQARKHVWVPFFYPIGGISQQTTYQLPYWIERDDQVLGFSQQLGDTIDQHRYASTSSFRIRQDGSGGTVLDVPNGLAANSLYRLEGVRNPPPYTADTGASGGIWPLSEQQRRLWTLWTVVEACQRIAQTHSSTAEDRSTWQGRLVQWSQEAKRLSQDINPWNRARSPRRDPWVVVSGGAVGSGVARSRYY